jgi:uncharacterized protein (DUF433 family)
MTTSTPKIVDLSKYIELRDNHPQVRGRRLPVVFIAAAERKNHLSIAELAYQFTLSEEQVLAALLYYREHQAEIDAQDAVDTQQSLEMHQQFGNRSR